MAKQLEHKLFLEQYHSKAGYETEFLKIRSLLKTMEHFRKLSKKLEASDFDHEYLKKLVKLDELELKTHERLLPEPESNSEAKTYDPLMQLEPSAVKKVASGGLDAR